MQELTVFLAPAGPAAGVLDVLADLSGAGLVDPFLWVTDSDVTEQRHEAESIVGGRRGSTTVESVVADGRFGRVRFCVVVPLFGAASTVSNDVEQELAELVEFRAGRGVKVTRVRCLLAPHGSAADPGAAARDGWHNVLIAPEDSRGPDSGLSLQTTIDPIEIGRYAAPAVAGVVGLWVGMATSGLDTLPAPAGPNIRAVRSYYRRVDADDVERELRARVLTTQPELPLPRDQTASTVYIEEVAQACRTMAGALWGKYPHALKGPRVNAGEHPPKPLGYRTAISWLWGFLVAAFRRAPMDWYDAKVAQYSSMAAAKVHRSVLGSAPSAYTVVVNGMTPSGVPASWQDVGVASGQLDSVNFDPDLEPHQEPRVDLSPLWKDYVNGALTLCDGGARDMLSMPPYPIGSNRGVLRSVDDCVPAPEDEFVAIPGYLAVPTGVQRVQAGDVLGADMLRRQLQHVSQDPSLALDTGRPAHALATWSATHHHTYAVQVGNTLARAWTSTIEEIRYYLARLREAAAAQETDAAGTMRRQRRLARWMIVLAVLAVLVVVGAGVLAGVEVIAVSTAVAVGVIALVGWLVGSIVSFAQGQREMFRDLNRRRTLLTEVNAIRTNLRQAIKDLRRLGDAYGQYLLWTRVIGRVLRQPYGPPPSAAVDGLRIARGLPRTTRIAQAEVDEAAMGDAAAIVRRDLFVTGWLSEPWGATLAAAPARLGPRGHELSRDPQAIFDLQGRPLEGSPQQIWGELLVRAGTETATGDLTWQRVRSSLDQGGSRFALALSLLSSVRGVEQGAAPAGPIAEFLSGIDQLGARSGQRFLGEHYTAEALAAEAGRVTIDHPAGWRLGLSGARVLVQYTDAMPAHMFRVAERLSAAPFREPGSVRTERPEDADSGSLTDRNGAAGRTSPGREGDVLDGPVF